MVARFRYRTCQAYHVRLVRDIELWRTVAAELREFNELNWERFEAKLDQRIAELRAELGAKIETSAADLKTYVERALKEQSRRFIAAWAVLLGSNIALWFR